MIYKVKNWAKKDPFFAFTTLIVAILAIFFRFYNYFGRVYIYSDHALFLQAARYAHDNFLIPQIGPFAQAPFFTGPWWLWFLDLTYFLPLGFFTPWFVMSALSLGFVLLIFWVGREIGDKWMGLTSALMAALSPAQIDNSFTVWNAGADSFLGLLSIVFLLLFYKSKRNVFVFLIGFCVSLAITIHFQTTLLAPIFLTAFVLRPRIKTLVFLAIGAAIPLLPFLFFDLRFNWFETKRIWDYTTIGQYRIYVPNRWLTYAGVYWPNVWGSIIGGNKWVGGTLMGLLAFLFLIRLRSFGKYKKFYMVAITFALIVLAFRYYRGERFFYYSNFSHPYVVILSAWVLAELFKVRKLLGLAALFLVLTFTLPLAAGNFKNRDITFGQIDGLKKEIYEKFPGEKFDVFGCTYNGALVSHPLSYLMYTEGRNSMSGTKIGVCQLNDKSISWVNISGDQINVENSPWLNESTENVYKTMTEWWKTNPPR